MPEDAEEPRLQQDPLVERLIPDPAQPADVAAFVGFLGKSPEAGLWRLYLTPELDEYLEVAEDDVVHSHALSDTESSFGGTVIWVRKSARMAYRESRPQRTQAEFLRGAYTQQLVDEQSAAAGAAMYSERAAAASTVPCGLTLVLCPQLPSALRICGSADVCVPTVRSCPPRPPQPTGPAAGCVSAWRGCGTYSPMC